MRSGCPSSQVKSENMIFETVLLLIGSAIAAIAIAIITYDGFSTRRASSAKVSISDISQTPTPQSDGGFPHLHEPANHVEDSWPEHSVPPTVPSNLSVATAPIQEAPAPFPEESSPNPSAAPTDVTALANAVSAVDATQGVLVIPTPKRRARTRRLPSEGAPAVPRKRRTPRKKTIIPETTTFIEGAPIFGETQPTDTTRQLNE